MLNTLKEKNNILIIASLLLAGGIVVAVYLLTASGALAINSCDSGWRVGSAKDVTCHNECRKVSNTGGSDFFIPTRTAGEWQEFRNNPPPNATFQTKYLVNKTAKSCDTDSGSCSKCCDGGTRDYEKYCTWTETYRLSDCSLVTESKSSYSSWTQSCNTQSCPSPTGVEPDSNKYCERCSTVNSYEKAAWYESDGDCGRDAVSSDTARWDCEEECGAVDYDPNPDEDDGPCAAGNAVFCSQCSTVPEHEGELATWYEKEGADCDRDPLSDVCGDTTYTEDSSCEPEEEEEVNQCEDYTGEACGSGGECQTSNDCSYIEPGTSCTVDGESGTYESGLCPGGTETRCCEPDTSSSCTDYTGTSCGSGGECQTSNDCSYIEPGTSCTVNGESGTYQSGLCSGGTETRCCVPNSTSGGGGTDDDNTGEVCMTSTVTDDKRPVCTTGSPQYDSACNFIGELDCRSGVSRTCQTTKVYVYNSSGSCVFGWYQNKTESNAVPCNAC